MVRSMCLPAVLHGIQASLFASDSLRKLRSSMLRVVWSRRQPLACVGAVLSLLDGPTGCDLAFCVVWFRFRSLRFIWLFGLQKLVGFIVFWRWWVWVAPGHGPVHLLSTCAAVIGFRWDPLALAWARPGLPLLSNLAALFNIVRLLLLMLGGTRLQLICCWEGFRSGSLLDVHGSLQLLNSLLMKEWSLTVGFVNLTGLVMTLLMRLLTLVVGVLVTLLSMRVVICLEFCGRWYPVLLDLHRFFIATS